ncbi:uracil phosphoribosyltransferase-domain-containing protein [Spinellus fusiger]|nr:uracil phosphoribosyltransferase-domain-containing protein [Spinellus fusiger]
MSGTLIISKHPIVATKLSQLRDVNQSSKAFRQLVSELSTLIGYEASANVETVSGKTLMSPYESYPSTELKERIALVPVLRSGLSLVDGFLTLFPDAHVLHLGLFREKISLQPVEYYNKLPHSPNVDMCFILDPIIATGNTAVATINILKEWGIPGSQIKYVSIVASQQGITQIQKVHSDVIIYVAGVDNKLDTQGYIRPGIGDAGDRLFNTAS